MVVGELKVDGSGHGMHVIVYGLCVVAVEAVCEQ